MGPVRCPVVTRSPLGAKTTATGSSSATASVLSVPLLRRFRIVPPDLALLLFAAPLTKRSPTASTATPWALTASSARASPRATNCRGEAAAGEPRHAAGRSCVVGPNRVATLTHATSCTRTPRDQSDRRADGVTDRGSEHYPSRNNTLGRAVDSGCPTRRGTPRRPLATERRARLACPRARDAEAALYGNGLGGRGGRQDVINHEPEWGCPRSGPAWRL